MICPPKAVRPKFLDSQVFQKVAVKIDKEHAKGSDSNKVEVKMKLSPIDRN